jgi:hypothetical protein
MGSLPFCLGWPRTSILPIFDSCVAGITGLNHGAQSGILLLVLMTMADSLWAPTQCHPATRIIVSVSAVTLLLSFHFAGHTGEAR